MAGRGMATVVGRIRPDPLFDYKFVVLSHNTIRGAAGGSIYNAELMLSKGMIRLKYSSFINNVITRSFLISKDRLHLVV